MIPTSPRAARRLLAALAVLAAAAAPDLAGVAAPTRAQTGDPLARAAWRAQPGGPPRAAHRLIYDAPADRLLALGGEEAPFVAPAGDGVFDPAIGAWAPLAARGTAPVSRLEGRGVIGSAVVVDAAERAALMQCDCADGTAYLLDLATDTWSAAPSVEAAPYADAVMAYDPPADRALLFGGALRGLDEPSPTAFAFDLSPARTGWSSLSEAPFALQYQSGAIDEDARAVYAFGGLDALGAASAALWRLDLAAGTDAWAELAPADGASWPGARIGATLTFFDAGLALLFGGYVPSVGRSLGDLWLLDARAPDGPRWREVVLPGAPAARSGHAAAWDAARRALVVHGGIVFVGPEPRYVGETWALELDPPEATATATPTATATGGPSPPTPTASAPPTRTPVGRIHLPLALRAARLGAP